MFSRWSTRLVRNSLERRLFGWLLAVLLLPSLLIVATSLYLGSRSVEWMGTLGPWNEVAESGRALLDATAPHASEDSALAAARARHEQQLSTSVTQAGRWAFLGDRVRRMLPFTLAAVALLLFLLAYRISRRISKQLARPIGQLVEWTGELGEGRPLPPPTPEEQKDVNEVRVLRGALRDAAVRIQEGRSRALEAERVRAWGEMARRVAHEMKNPLTPLRLAVHRITRTSEDGRLQEPLAVIAEEITRLEELARQFALLGRPSSGPRSDVDIGEMLQDLLATDVPPGIATTLRLSPELPLLHGHFDALQRAFRNLLRNAVEAIEARTGGAAAEPGHIEVSAELAGPELRVLIRDNGCGIPPDRADRIFEPDYTLKAGGTGLGLALVRQAVLAHDGDVHVRGGQAGATFEVRLPAARAPNLRAGNLPDGRGGTADEAGDHSTEANRERRA